MIESNDKKLQDADLKTLKTMVAAIVSAAGNQNKVILDLNNRILELESQIKVLNSKLGIKTSFTKH
jgi:hypothetical protein